MTAALLARDGPPFPQGRTGRDDHGAPAADRLGGGIDPGGVLSIREREVLRLLGRGYTNKEVAQHLGVAPETIKSHMKHIFRKLAVARRAHAVSKGHALGLIDGERRGALTPA